nr:PREDICTED: uncharacterized protein LOC103556557 [Equus przewalskii]
MAKGKKDGTNEYEVFSGNHFLVFSSNLKNSDKGEICKPIDQRLRTVRPLPRRSPHKDPGGRAARVRLREQPRGAGVKISSDEAPRGRGGPGRPCPRPLGARELEDECAGTWLRAAGPPDSESTGRRLKKRIAASPPTPLRLQRNLNQTRYSSLLSSVPGYKRFYCEPFGTHAQEFLQCIYKNFSGSGNSSARSAFTKEHRRMLTTTIFILITKERIWIREAITKENIKDQHGIVWKTSRILKKVRMTNKVGNVFKLYSG